ncbi:helix-turn-helix domain-containing protein [Actinomadura scrupuli]|uniref:nSTAND1 domain-containing NTPase n=1 Tax=Actinomadura scrupuli TaxID=559629 RepID=UPI003D973441
MAEQQLPAGFSPDPVGPDPDRITDRFGFGRELSSARELAGLTVREMAKRSGIPHSTLGGYLKGRHLPPLGQSDLLTDLLRACGIEAPDLVDRWRQALLRVRRAPGRVPTDGPVPYRGLESFQAEDAEWFFGREELTSSLVAAVSGLADSGGGLLAVVGPSGAGKSSLLRAGLIPALRSGEQGSWPVLLTNPGKPGELARNVADLRDAAGTGPFVLVVDQFEEIFSLDVAQRREIVGTVCSLAATASGEPPGIAVLGLRADFYGSALGYAELADAMQHAQVNVGPMTEQGIRQAILQPARRANLDVEEGLVALLLRDLVPSSAPLDPGALPLLSHTLFALWERGRRRRLTVTDYSAAGGIHGSVAATAETVFMGLGAWHQEIARRLFLRLVRIGKDVADTRRSLPREEVFHRLEEREADALALVLDRFVERRLITVAEETVEISHEVLLRAWPRLGGWIDADRAALLVEQQIAEAAEAWAAESRDPAGLLRGSRLSAAQEWAGSGRLVGEYVAASFRHQRRGIRRLYQVIVALVALTALAIVLAVVSFEQRAGISHERSLAVSRLVASEADRIRDSDTSLSAQLSLAAYRIASTNEARSALFNSSAISVATRLLGPVGELHSVAFAPDGRTLAAVGADAKVRLWDTTDPRRPDRHPIELPASQASLTSLTLSLSTVAFSGDGTLLAASGADTSVRLWNTADPQHPRPLPALTGPAGMLHTVAFSPDRRLLVAGSAQRDAFVWNLATPERPPVRLGEPSGPIQSVAFSPDGRILAIGGGAKTVRLWDVSETPTPVGQPLRGATSDITSLAFSPNGRLLAVGGRDRAVRLWDLVERNSPRPHGGPLTGPASYVYSVAFSPDSSVLAVGSADDKVRMWDVARRQVMAVLPHPEPVTAVAFRRDGGTLATASTDGAARIWALPGPVLTGPQGHVYAVAFSPDGRFLVGAGEDRKLWTWELDQLADPTPLGSPVTSSARFVIAVAFSRDGRTLAAGGADNRVWLWDMSNPRTPVRLGAPLRGPTGWVESVAFSPDGRTLAAAGDDAVVRLWNMDDRAYPQLLATLKGATGGLFYVAFSPDGRLLAAASTDRAVHLWQVDGSPRLLHTFPVPEGSAYSVAFSPDSRTLAAGSTGKTVRLWDVTDPGRPAALGTPILGLNGYVYSVMFDRTGQRLLAAGTDRTVRLWNIDDRRHPEALATLTGPGEAVLPAVFSPDATAVAAGGMDKTVRLWDIDPDRVSAEVCAVAGEPIRPAEWRQYVPGLRYNPPCP